MRNSARNSTQALIQAPTPNVGEEEKSAFFIPGITARARCLEGETAPSSYPKRANSCPIPNRRVGLSRQSSRSSVGSYKSTSSRRSTSSARSTLSSRLSAQRDDQNFKKMMKGLKKQRKSADIARETALDIKRRFENERQ